MKKYYCNPLNINYKYQYTLASDGKTVVLDREAADPSLVLFKGRYYMFPSMSKGFYHSADLAQWEFCPLEGVPVYDYAPDVCVVGDYLYYCASHRDTPCDFFRTKDPLGGKFERFEGTFDFWDPALFCDDDGKLYFYWGCSNCEPIYGAELDPETMHIKGEPVGLVFGNESERGYERSGEDHIPQDSGVLAMMQKQFSEHMGVPAESITEEQILAQLPDNYRRKVHAAIAGSPYVEGAWMSKHGGKYYLQYAVNGTQFNVYADGVYVSDSPLGPFVPAENNPYSYRPAGFATGAGHGSTLEDKEGNVWHAATISVSVHHDFERRLGLWKAGYDKDGELFCNQRFGDWVTEINGDAWQEPEWMLLSYGKTAVASSEQKPAANIADENIRTWWQAKESGPAWVRLDLGHVCDVRAVQVNFADDICGAAFPQGADIHIVNHGKRYIDDAPQRLRWLLEGSLDNDTYFVLEDKRAAETDLPHDLVVKENGVRARYLRLTVYEMPYGQPACVSDLRVFGRGGGNAPKPVKNVRLFHTSALDFAAEWEGNAVGYNVLWGHEPDKLYHCKQVLGSCKTTVGALVAGQKYFVRVDAFNEDGIAHGEVLALD